MLRNSKHRSDLLFDPCFVTVCSGLGPFFLVDRYTFRRLARITTKELAQAAGRVGGGRHGGGFGIARGIGGDVYRGRLRDSGASV